MTKTDRSDGSNAKRCPECGVEFRASDKYCDFCGTKVADEALVPATAKSQAPGRAGGMLKGLAVGFLAIGILIYVGNRLGGEDSSPPSPPPPPSVADGKHQAAASCEAAIRQQVRGPFRVIAFRSILVAEERGGYVVSGTFELQSPAGELQWKRYFCKLHPDARAGMVLDEGRMD